MIYRDERGEIRDVAEMDFRALQIITSKKGTIRSNHLHKKGAHLLHVMSGKMRYVECPLLSDLNYNRREFIVNEGESVFTGPMMAHATEFLEDTVLICASTVARADGAYDSDLVRVKII